MDQVKFTAVDLLAYVRTKPLTLQLSDGLCSFPSSQEQHRKITQNPEIRSARIRWKDTHDLLKPGQAKPRDYHHSPLTTPTEL